MAEPKAVEENFGIEGPLVTAKNDSRWAGWRVDGGLEVGWRGVSVAGDGLVRWRRPGWEEEVLLVVVVRDKGSRGVSADTWLPRRDLKGAGSFLSKWKWEASRSGLFAAGSFVRASEL